VLRMGVGGWPIRRNFFSATSCCCCACVCIGGAAPAAHAYLVDDPPVHIAPPVISGLAVDGQTLTTSDGEWSGTRPITYGYRWRRCDATGADCSDLAGATDRSYTLTPAYVGASLRARVFSTNAAGTDYRSSLPWEVVGSSSGTPRLTAHLSGTACAENDVPRSSSPALPTSRARPRFSLRGTRTITRSRATSPRSSSARSDLRVCGQRSPTTTIRCCARQRPFSGSTATSAMPLRPLPCVAASSPSRAHCRCHFPSYVA